jgi:hypothetical protein
MLGFGHGGGSATPKQALEPPPWPKWGWPTTPLFLFLVFFF